MPSNATFDPISSRQFVQGGLMSTIALGLAWESLRRHPLPETGLLADVV
jgi:hypothetical protein